MTKKDKTYELIVKRLTNEISEEENALLDQQFEQKKFSKSKFDLLSGYWRMFFPKPVKHSIIEKTEKKLGFTYHAGAGRTKSYNWLKIAASILLIVSVGYSLYTFVKPNDQLVLNEYRCENGEQKRVVLSDGTSIWMNSSSHIIACEPFSGNTREVILYGEAYFEVAHNPEKPFIVKTSNLQTKVLGTKFNITSSGPHHPQEISLYEGSVELTAENASHNKVIMHPGETAIFSPDNGEIAVTYKESGKPAQWRDGILHFDNEDLFSITRKLERKYDTKIFVTDPAVGRLRYTAEFQDESVDSILRILCEAKEFYYENASGGIIIKAKNK
jgi:ferric-dicitrate binding protein FerR (iron transport regulator)